MKQNRKILIVTGVFPPDIGGPATYSKMLLDELPKIGVSAEVLSFGGVRWLPKGVSHAVFFLKVLLRARGAKSIYAQDPVSVGLPSLYAAKILRKNFFLKVVGDYAWEQGGSRFGIQEPLDDFSKKRDGYPFFVSLLKRIEIYVTCSAEKVIVPSRYLKGILQNWGVDHEKIVVIYNSFEGAGKRPLNSKGALRQILQFDGELIISVGRLVPWKGFKALIEIMPYILKHHPKARLLIVGDGPERGALKKLKGALKLSHKHVVFTGSVPHETLLNYLRASDVFVLNTFYEGFSHVLLEAMALGVPVITTPVGGNNEIIRDEENGLFVGYNNRNALRKAIRRTLDDASLCKKLTQGGEHTVQKFTKETMLTELTTTLS